MREEVQLSWNLRKGTPAVAGVTKAITARLTDLGLADQALTEYIVVLLLHGNSQHVTADQLQAFMGDDQAADFAAWLFRHLEDEKDTYTKVEAEPSGAALEQKSSAAVQHINGAGQEAGPPDPPPASNGATNEKSRSHSREISRSRSQDRKGEIREESPRQGRTPGTSRENERTRGGSSDRPRDRSRDRSRDRYRDWSRDRHRQRRGEYGGRDRDLRPSERSGRQTDRDADRHTDRQVYRPSDRRSYGEEHGKRWSPSSHSDRAGVTGRAEGPRSGHGPPHGRFDRQYSGRSGRQRSPSPLRHGSGRGHMRAGEYSNVDRDRDRDGDGHRDRFEGRVGRGPHRVAAEQSAGQPQDRDGEQHEMGTQEPHANGALVQPRGERKQFTLQSRVLPRAPVDSGLTRLLTTAVRSAVTAVRTAPPLEGDSNVGAPTLLQEDDDPLYANDREDGDFGWRPYGQTSDEAEDPQERRVLGWAPTGALLESRSQDGKRSLQDKEAPVGKRQRVGDANNNDASEELATIKAQLTAMRQHVQQLREAVPTKQSLPVPPAKAPVSFQEAVAAARAAEEARSVAVHNVGLAIPDEVVKAHFSVCGPMLRVTRLKNKATGVPSQTVLIEFASVAGANSALSLSGSLLLQSIIQVVRKNEMPSTRAPPRGMVQGAPHQVAPRQLSKTFNHGSDTPRTPRGTTTPSAFAGSLGTSEALANTTDMRPTHKQQSNVSKSAASNGPTPAAVAVAANRNSAIDVHAAPAAASGAAGNGVSVADGAGALVQRAVGIMKGGRGNVGPLAGRGRSRARGRGPAAGRGPPRSLKYVRPGAATAASLVTQTLGSSVAATPQTAGGVGAVNASMTAVPGDGVADASCNEVVDKNTVHHCQANGAAADGHG